MSDAKHLKLNGYPALLADHCELADAVAALTARVAKLEAQHAPEIYVTPELLADFVLGSGAFLTEIEVVIANHLTRPARPRRGRRTPGCPATPGASIARHIMGDYPPEFLALLTSGTALRLNYGPGNVNNCRRHIRAIVDDDQVVYRVWSARRGWLYRVESAYALYVEWKQGVLRKVQP